MKTKTVLVASQKGGSGKTTIVAHLSVESERSDKAKSFLVDTDPQASLSTWHRRREKDTPARIDVTISRIGEAIDKLEASGADFVFIDSAPTISEHTATLIALSDFIIVPVRPSPTDLWSVGQTIELIKKAGKPFLFVLNQAKMNATITAQAVEALRKHGPVAPTIITDRVVYASSMVGGLTAQEVERGAASVEIADLWFDVRGCMI